MSTAEVKQDRKYTKDHEWLTADGKIGITAFAVEQLGDITLVDITVKPGDTLEAGAVFGTVESVKTLSDLFSPVSGTVTAVNAALEDKPELINEDCWEAGWIIQVESISGGELLEAGAYEATLGDA